MCKETEIKTAFDIQQRSDEGLVITECLTSETKVSRDKPNISKTCIL